MSRLAERVFSLAGWRVEGAPPPERKFVLIAAPHTSNWDAVIMLFASRIFGIELAWFVKDAWFRGPLGPIMRRLGGVPVDRSRSHGMVDRAIREFAERDALILVVPPEGTRGRAPHWKSGFYHIAHGAHVPIVLGYIDYARKVAGLGPVFHPTGDIDADFAYFRSFYETITPRFADKFGPIAPPPRA